MIKSMTGYGKCEVAVGSKKITVEIRSLNSKQLDLAVKMPGVYRKSEYDIRGMVAKSMQRGKIDIYVNVDSGAVSGAATINGELFAEYVRQLKAISSQNGLAVDDSKLVSTILRLPEVVSSDVAAIDQTEHDALISAVEGALINIDSFRVQEGKILIDDLLVRVEKICSLMIATTPFEKARVELVKTRIRESIEAASLVVDNNRLEQEIIYYIEKLDVTEEKVRLENHCNYFREVAAEDQGVGRKLGFIAQEMGREINTMGSKANDASIQRFVVEMKDELEKIKEQLLNIL